MTERHDLGRRAERRAAGHLMRRGWRILGRNVRVAGVEIDILATHGGVLVAIEVKARSADAPLELVVGPAQRRRLAGALEALAARRPALAPRGLRVDLIVVGPQPWSRPRRIADIATDQPPMTPFGPDT